MLKDILEEVHIKSFTGLVAAVNGNCWIHKAAILATETLRYVESMLFSLLVLSSRFTKAEMGPNAGTSFVRCVELCMK